MVTCTALVLAMRGCINIHILPTCALIACVLTFLQKDFTVRIQSKSALSVSDLSASNGEVMSVTPVSGSGGSYDVRVAAKKSGLVAVSTIASAAIAASTIDVNIDTEPPQVCITWLES